MIDTREYKRFLELHDISRQLRFFVRNYDELYVSKAERVIVKLQGRRVKKYDYFWHDRFGVVRALNDGGTLIDKSPVCEALDRELFV